MSTLTVNYNPNNAFALSVIEMMRQSGVFDIVSETSTDALPEEQEREAFLYTSKVNASKMFAKYL